MKQLFLLLITLCSISTLTAAYQYETKGNQLWLTFDSSTTVAFDIGRSGKDKDHENFIDRGEGIVDYGWYNLDTGATGSFDNGMSATFSETDRIGLYVKDKDGKVFISTKSEGKADLGKNVVWGKSDEVDGAIALYGGNKGSNGTHEHYVFKVSTANNTGNKTPSGQPLPGIIATLVLGGGTALYLKKRKKLYAEK